MHRHSYTAQHTDADDNTVISNIKTKYRNTFIQMFDNDPQMWEPDTCSCHLMPSFYRSFHCKLLYYKNQVIKYLFFLCELC